MNILSKVNHILVASGATLCCLLLIPVFFSAESAAPRAAFGGAGRLSVYVLAAARMAAAAGSRVMGTRGCGSSVNEPMGFSNQTTSRQRPFL